MNYYGLSHFVQIDGDVFPTIPPLFLRLLLHRRLIHHRSSVTRPVLVTTPTHARVRVCGLGFARAGLVEDMARDVGLVVDVGGVLAVNLSGRSTDLLHIEVLRE